MRSATLILLISFISTKLYSLPIPSEELFRAPDSYSYKINQDSSYIAGHVAREGEMALEILDMDLKTAQQIVSFKWDDDAYLKDYYWMDKDTLYVKYRDGYQSTREAFIELTKTADNKIKTRFRKIKSKGKILDLLPNEKNKILYIKRTGPKASNIKIYKTTRENLIRNEFNKQNEFRNTVNYAFYYATNAQGKIKFASSYEDEELKFWYLNNKNRKWVNFHVVRDEDYDFTPVAFLDEGKLAVITNKTSDLQGLYEFDIKTKQLGKLLFQHPKYDLSGARFDATTKQLVYVRFYDHGQLETLYFSGEDSRLSKLLKQAFPSKQLFITSTRAGNKYSIIKAFASNDPGKLYLFNQNTKKATLIAPHFENLDKYKMDRSEVFSVVSEKNRTIEAILTKPKINSNGILLVVPHGGPIGIRDYDFFNKETQYFVSRGFTILKINYSGSSGFGKKFQKSGEGQFGKRIEEDITAVVNYVKKKNKFSKMCSMGSSYGGYSAMMLAIYHPKDYQCVVAKYGVYDLSLLFNESNILRQKKHLDRIIAIVGEYSESLKDVSPFFLAEKVKSPVLLIAGKDDKVASFEHTNRMKYRLKQLKAPVETMFYEGVGHGHATWNGEKHEMAVVNEFLQKQLSLPIPTSKSYKKILGDEFMMISDGYNSDDFVINDYAKALLYMKKAANLGHPRGMFNLGAYYHQGKEVEKNIQQAVSWYKKSSALGYSSASYRLGGLYRTGREVLKNSAQADKYYELALQQGEIKAQIEIDKKKCFANNALFNLDSCLSSLSEAKQVKSNKDRVWRILTDVIWDKPRTNSEKQRVDQFLLKNYKVNITRGLEFDFHSYGTLSGSKKTRQGVDFEEKGKKVKLVKGKKFGIKYQIESDNLPYKPKGLIKVKWRHPEITDPETKQTKTEHLSIETVFMYGQSYYRNNYSWYQFDEKWEMVPGDWTIEISTIDDKPLYSRTFKVVEE